MDSSTKKGLPLYLLKVLEKYSDEDHILKQQDLIKLIDSEYDILFDRRTISSGIDFLRDMEYEIENIKNKGYYLKKRLFSLDEASYLIDAVFSSKSIDGKHAKELVDKIQSGLSKYSKQNFKYLYKTEEVNRTSNTQIMKNIKIIHQAINEEKRISFKYITYDNNGKEITRMNGYEYLVSPYYLINNFGRYYLLCHYRSKYGDLSHYRIDLMNDIKIVKEKDIKPLRELPSLNGAFSISDYINEHIYLFDGKSITCEMELKDSYVIQYVKDWFGKNAKITCFDNVIKASVRCNENAIFYWLMQYGEHVKIISPDYVIEKVINSCKEIINKHEEVE